MKYANLPYLKQEDFPSTVYAKASALRIPLRDAINTARMMPDEKMAEVVEVLETALRHIRQDTEETTSEDSSPEPESGSRDPLDQLLGAARAD